MLIYKQKNNISFIIYHFLWLSIIAGIIIAVFDKSAIQLFLITLLMIIVEEMYYFKNISDNIVYSLFILSYFIFVLGRLFVNYISYGQFNLKFDNEVTFHICICACIGVTFLHFGYILANWIQIIHKEEPNQIDGNKKIQSYARILMYGSYIFAIAEQLSIIIFIGNNSYVAYYVSYSSRLPRMLQILSNMYIVFFFLFLCTFPKKIDSYFPILLYVLWTFLTLAGGDRGNFVMNLSVLIVYMFWRQNHFHELWISKRMIAIGILFIPFVMAALSFFVKFRDDVDMSQYSSVALQLQRFIGISGNSGVNILGYGKIYQYDFPQRYYSLGGLYDYFVYNPFSNFIRGISRPANNTERYALIMHSYADAISYKIMKASYLTGHGAGSCYLAELYHDFGYVGVALGNVVCGWFINKCTTINTENPYILTLMFLMIRGIYYLPRGAFDTPLINVINYTTIFAIIIIWILSKNTIEIRLRFRRK